ncbi:transcriptional regulator domain-containing protein [Acetobacter syzygii]|uniref:transcriptional regulator domain-containing protein n=1 Tax=Acetobacter syzygii TaxID=146476 RepID=UPI0039E72C43
MPLDIWHSEADLAILRTLPASALAGAFMRRWSRYISDYRDTRLRAGASDSPSLLWAAFRDRWRLQFCPRS